MKKLALVLGLLTVLLLMGTARAEVFQQIVNNTCCIGFACAGSPHFIMINDTIARITFQYGLDYISIGSGINSTDYDISTNTITENGNVIRVLNQQFDNDGFFNLSSTYYFLINNANKSSLLSNLILCNSTDGKTTAYSDCKIVNEYIDSSNAFFSDTYSPNDNEAWIYFQQINETTGYWDVKRRVYYRGNDSFSTEQTLFSESWSIMRMNQVIKKFGSTYYLYYVDYFSALYVRSSADGVNFGSRNSLMGADSESEASIIELQGKYYIFVKKLSPSRVDAYVSDSPNGTFTYQQTMLYNAISPWAMVINNTLLLVTANSTTGQNHFISQWNLSVTPLPIPPAPENSTWYNTNYRNRREIPLNQTDYRLNEAVSFNFTGLNFSSLNELLIVDNHNFVVNATDINVSQAGNGDGWAYMKFLISYYTTETNHNYWLYYNYPSASSQGFNCTIFFDNFTYNNSNNWNGFVLQTNSTTMAYMLIDNGYALVEGSGTSQSDLFIDTGKSDGYMTIQAINLSGEGSHSIIGRQFYAEQYFDNHNSNVNAHYLYSIWDYFNGTLIATNSEQFYDGQLMGLSIYGSNINIYQNGTLITNLTDNGINPAGHTWWGFGNGGSMLWTYWDNLCFLYYPADSTLYCQTYDNGTELSLGSEENYTPTITLGITWVSPINNSFTANTTSIFWNGTVSSIPTTCILNIDGILNYSMLISGKNCYYTKTSLTNGTKYCGIIYASNGSLSGASDTQCQTINMTSTIVPPSPTPRPIDNLGLFAPVALLIYGAGIILFLFDALFSSGLNMKKAMTAVIGAIIFVGLMVALL